MKMLFPLLLLCTVVSCSNQQKKKPRFDMVCQATEKSLCDDMRRVFMEQYKHRGNHGEAYSHNFTLSNNQVLHITSSHEIVVNHNKEADRWEVHIKDDHE